MGLPDVGWGPSGPVWWRCPAERQTVWWRSRGFGGERRGGRPPSFLLSSLLPAWPMGLVGGEDTLGSVLISFQEVPQALPHHTRLSPKKDSTPPRTGIAKANAPPHSSSSPSLLIRTALKPVPVVLYVRGRFIAGQDQETRPRKARPRIH